MEEMFTILTEKTENSLLEEVEDLQIVKTPFLPQLINK